MTRVFEANIPHINLALVQKCEFYFETTEAVKAVIDIEMIVCDITGDDSRKIFQFLCRGAFNACA